MNEQTFNDIRKEHHEGHTPNYSALNWDLPVETILQVIKAKTYAEFKNITKVT